MSDYFGGDELPWSVFLDKYALRGPDGEVVEKDPDQMHRRLAREFARIERGKFREPLSEDLVYELFRDFGELIPQGSPMYGVGNDRFVSLSNCFVVDAPLDSYAGIHWTDEQLTQICKRRGGVGTDVSHLRPSGTATTNSARTSSGVTTFCQRFSNSIREVGQNGRRGALMLTLSVHHPDVLAFARMKLDPTAVTGANVSIRLSDEFLAAVDAGAPYEQRWPVEGEPVVRQMVDARMVWLEIVRCAWQRAEPGLLFWDQIIRESPADCYADMGFGTVSTNPCSELPICPLDSCRLLVQNLFAFVAEPFTSNARFDWERFRSRAMLAQRLMDDLVDLEIEAVARIIRKVESDPEPDEVKAREVALWRRVQRMASRGRRTGTGVTAVGDMLAALNIPYGGEESIEFVERVYREFKLACYRSSVEMARELGPFPLWNPRAEKDCPFLRRLESEDPVLYADMQQHGRRNVALLTTAPVGSTSILTGPGPRFGTTSGIEPLFCDQPHVRRKKITPGMKDARVDFVDAMGDRWTNYEVFHPKLRLWMDVSGETDWRKSPYHGCCAGDLDWKQRVRLQAAAQRHVDHGISSTINLPADVGVERVGEIYETAWKAGCKGITVYRDGCRDGVLVHQQTKPAAADAPSRPQSVACDVHHLTVRKTPFVVAVGLLANKPYEVFAFANAPRRVSSSVRSGVIVKRGRGRYDLVSADGEDLLSEGSLSGVLSETEEALTRMTSTALRHGVGVAFVVHQLEKTRGDLQSFSRALARSLKKYVADGTPVTGERCGSCGEESLQRQEGCVSCKSCGWSRC